MLTVSNIENGFPGGGESGESNDEWDIDHSSCTTNQEKEVSGSTLPTDDQVSVLKRAIAAGELDRVQILLESGVDVETRLGFGWTPLMCAVHVANYDLTKLLLDHGASANFSRDHYTVLMVACTADCASEDKIAKCVALLLSRNADPNVYNRNHMTCLMLAARVGYCQVINLLVSHRAQLDFQDDGGYTALMLAVQYGHEDAVLKLLLLGADKSIKSKAGNTAADLARTFKHPQISRILNSENSAKQSKAETEYTFLNQNPEPPSASKNSSLCDIELLLHGLNLEYLADIMKENDITWSSLMTMEKDDLEKIGIRDAEDQKKVLDAIEEMHLDQVEMDTLTQLDNIDSGSEELCKFLISLSRQCSYLTETVQDVISRFPCSPSELVLTWDPKKEARAICGELVVQSGDLQRQVACLRDLLEKMDPTEHSFHPSPHKSHTSRRRRVRRNLALAVLGVGLLLPFLCYRFHVSS